MIVVGVVRKPAGGARTVVASVGAFSAVTEASLWATQPSAIVRLMIGMSTSPARASYVRKMHAIVLGNDGQFICNVHGERAVHLTSRTETNPNR